MRVLGIDPGLRCTGYGVIEAKKGNFDFPDKRADNNITLLEAGVIKTSSKEKLATRLNRIYKGLLQVAELYQPQVIVIEELYSYYQNPRTAIIMAHARGVICLVGSQMNIDVIGYSAKRVKKSITGTGAAKKIQMQKVIKKMLNLKKDPTPDDIADALALAITYLHTFNKGL